MLAKEPAAGFGEVLGSRRLTHGVRGGADLSSHPCSVPSSLGGLGQPLSLEPRFPHLRGVLVVLPASRGGSLGL